MSQPYAGLTPDTVIDCIEQIGYRCDLRLLVLNSYENRVYQVGIEDETPVIAKFYREGRWTDTQILEEHEFALELESHGLSVVAPLVLMAQRFIMPWDIDSASFQGAVATRQSSTTSTTYCLSVEPLPAFTEWAPHSRYLTDPLYRLIEQSHKAESSF